MSNQNYTFYVNHITNESAVKRIYGIHIDNLNYFLSKTTGIVDCEQLDTNPPLDSSFMKEICAIITEIENNHPGRPSLDEMNKEILIIKARRKPPYQ